MSVQSLKPQSSWLHNRLVAKRSDGGYLVSVSPLVEVSGVHQSAIAIRYDPSGHAVAVLYATGSFEVPVDETTDLLFPGGGVIHAGMWQQ